MVLEFPPELPDLDSSEQLPELSGLPDLDLDSDLALESKPSLSANTDFDLDDLLNFNSDFNSEFEKEFGLEEQSTSEVNDINDLLDQLQTDSDFIMASLETLEELTPLDSEDLELTPIVTAPGLADQAAEFDFAGMLDDFVSAETMITALPTDTAKDGLDSLSEIEPIDQLLDSMQGIEESAEDLSLPDLDDSFMGLASDAVASEVDNLEDQFDPFSDSASDSEILSENSSESLSFDSEMAGLSELSLDDSALESLEISDLNSSLDELLSDTLSDSLNDPLSDPLSDSLNDPLSDPLSDSLTDNPIAEMVDTETIDLVEEFDPFSQTESQADSLPESLSFESDVAELSGLSLDDSILEPLELADLNISFAESLTDTLADSEIAEMVDTETIDLVEEFDPFDQAISQAENLGDSLPESLSFEPEMAELSGLSLEDSIQNPVSDLPVSDLIDHSISSINVPEFSTSTDLELSGLSDIESDIADVAIGEVVASVDEIDPFEQSVNLPELQPEIEFESQALQETFEPSPISDFTAILTSETTEENLGSISAPILESVGEVSSSKISESNIQPETPDTISAGIAEDLTAEKFAENEEQIETFTQSFEDQDPAVSDFTQILTSAQVARSMVEEEELVAPDLAESENSSNNRFTSSQSTPVSLPNLESFEPETPESSNGSIDSQESDESPNPLVKFGLPIALIGLLVGGIVMITKPQGSNNPPPNPPAQTN